MQQESPSMNIKQYYKKPGGSLYLLLIITLILSFLFYSITLVLPKLFSASMAA